MSADDDADGPVTVASFESGERALIIIGFPLVGVLAGLLLPLLADWVTTLEWAPFQGPLELIASWDAWWSRAVVLGVGLLAGGGLAAYAIHDTVKVTIGDDSVTLSRADRQTEYWRAQVDAVFVDAKVLVLLDSRTAELAREPFDAATRRLAEGFRRYGYPWNEADPHAAAYRRWIDGAPELQPGEHLVLRTRAKALAGGEKAEAADLRNELGKVGLVVRDEGNRQYWRRVH